MDAGAIALDALIVPIRNVREAASSRLILEVENIHRYIPEVSANKEAWRTWGGNAAGGATFSLEPIDQARMLSLALYRLVEVALDYDVPIVFMKYPRFAMDFDYAYRALGTAVPGFIDRERFAEAFRVVADASKVRVEEELTESGQASSDVSDDELPSVEEIERIALRRLLPDVRAQLLKSRSERDRLTAERDAIAEELALYKHSRSWAITKPLRAIGIRMRGLRR
jgi:hypothetical protein